jgi:serine protease Do
MDFPSLGVLARTHVNIGAEVIAVARGSAAENAGLQVGYLIDEADGNQVRNVSDLLTVIANRAPGSRIRLGWMFHSGL